MDTTWTEKEEKQLKELLNNNTSISNISKIINRSERGIKRKMKALGLEDPNSNYSYWSDEDVEKIITLLPNHTISEISSIMGNRSEKGIKKKIESLGLESPYVCKSWSDDEIKELFELLPTTTLTEVSKKINRSEKSIKKKLKEIMKNLMPKVQELEKNGAPQDENYKEVINVIKICYETLNPHKEYEHWTYQEIEELKELGNNHTFQEIASIFDNKSLVGIQDKLDELCISSLERTSIITQYIKDNYETKTNVEIAQYLKISTPTVVRYARSLGLSKNVIKWTEEKINELKEYAKTHNVYEISEQYELSKDYVKELLDKYGIEPQKYKVVRSNWTEQDIVCLTALWGNISIDNIARELQKTKNAVMYKASCLGLEPYTDNLENGLRVSEISSMLGISEEKINTTWFNLGLNIQTVPLAKNLNARYVVFNELLEFLFNNQDIWDASKINAEYLVDLPEWVTIKAQNDSSNPPDILGITREKMIRSSNLQN